MKRFIFIALFSCITSLWSYDNGTAPVAFYFPTELLFEAIDQQNEEDLIENRSLWMYCDLNTGRGGWTALSKALSKNFTLLADEFKIAGASYYEAVKRAIEYNNVDALVILTDFEQINMSILELDNTGITPLSYALYLNKRASINYLINKAQATVSDALSIAIQKINTKLVEDLLEKAPEECNQALYQLIESALINNENFFLEALHKTFMLQKLNEYLYQLTQSNSHLFASNNLAYNFYFVGLIVEDNLEKMELFIEQAGSKLSPEEMLLLALKNNAEKFHSWLLEKNNNKIPFYIYRLAIDENDSTFVQNSLANALKAFKIENHDSSNLKKIKYELEIQLLEKINDLKNHDTRTSWNKFYHQTVQPIIDAINDTNLHSL